MKGKNEIEKRTSSASNSIEGGCARLKKEKKRTFTISSTQRHVGTRGWGSSLLTIKLGGWGVEGRQGILTRTSTKQ